MISQKISSSASTNLMAGVTLSQVVYMLFIADLGIHKFQATSCKHNQYQITSVPNVYTVASESDVETVTVDRVIGGCTELTPTAEDLSVTFTESRAGPSLSSRL